MPIRILIADDHGLLRAGLRALLKDEPDLEVVGEALDSEDTIQKAMALRPDVVLLDISMPGRGGIEVTRILKKTLPEIRILILTVHEDEGLLREAIRRGASGYIIKRAVEEELVHAIRAVWRGDLYIHPAMTRALLKELNPPPIEPLQVEPLTPRELEVLRLIALGYTNRQIAEELGISIRTVETHRANLMGKLGLSSRVELVRYAREHGLI
ncbi:Oxygen regulatory protein NreC [Candidatus Thermoflexus japonica]|uniref:Oxygen regulatory protein NreC n=1 Tax=Candidatus Thermoflexus japonica TaxID=2035417 RepID=A0A2H5Y9L5_9CHLR|nr:Oxygen regulatory protein NreC [Candidatus Thermoflexus japonica]